MKRNGTDFDDVKSGRQNRPKIADLVDLYKLPDGKWATIRFVGGVFVYSGYFVVMKPKDGSESKGGRNRPGFYMPSPSFNPETQTYDSTIYDPFYEYSQHEYETLSKEERDNRLINVSKYGYVNAIIRSEERKAPSRLPKHTPVERKSGFKDKDSDSWTPIKVLRLSGGVMSKLKDLAALNTVTIKGQTKGMSVMHPKYGMDIRIMYDSSKAPANQYTVAPGDRTPITEDQEAYLKYDLSELETPDDEAQIKQSYERWAKAWGFKSKKKAAPVDEDEEDDFDEEDEAPRKKKAPAKGKKKVVEDDDDADFDEEDDDDAPPPKKKKKVVEEDDDADFDEDDEFGDEEEEEDDAPPPKKGKKKPVVDEDDEEGDEEEDEFDEEEDEEPAPRKKGKKVVDEDEDDDAPWDDDEEEPAPKKKPAGKKKPVDDDEDDDFDEEDEEDEEPAPRKKAAKKAPARKKPPVDEDEEEEDFDDEEEEDDDPPPRKKKPAPAAKRRRA